MCCCSLAWLQYGSLQVCITGLLTPSAIGSSVRRIDGVHAAMMLDNGHDTWLMCGRDRDQVNVRES